LKDITSERSQTAIEFFKNIIAIYDELFPQNLTEPLEQDKPNRFRNDIEGFYVEYIKQGRDLRRFLEAGADNILLEIEEMARYRSALKATEHEPDIVAVTGLQLDYSCWRSPDRDQEFEGKKMYTFHVIIKLLIQYST
jgi:hypothetical protein